MFASLFKNSRRHKQIVEAIATAAKGVTREQIVKKTGLPNGGSLTEALEELEQCGFIRRYRAIGKKKKEVLYQLVDFFSNFHLRFLEDEKAGEQEYWIKYSSSPAHNAWSGYSFEIVCLSHISQLKLALGISGVISPVCSWRSSYSVPGVQIDLVIDRDDGIVNLCEAKYSIGEFTIDRAYHAILCNKKAAFIAETKTRKAIHLTMISTFGVTQNEYRDSIQSEITMDELFR